MAQKLNNVRYAVVDIETTGGHAAGCRIIEIAIIITDGKNVLETFETLVDPATPIPPTITGLTGINNDMLEKAPTFRQIAHKVYDLIENFVFVAHNVNFDYSFVRTELLRENYTIDLCRLCTVRMSRKIFPGYKSYSLGTLCGALGINIANRHRAMGDAYATYEVLKLLLHNDNEGHISKALNLRSKEQALPPNLPKEQFDNLSEETGVYYFYNNTGKIIYVGKAVNIKKRVAQHFTGNNKGLQRQEFLREIYSIGYELTGNELVALLLESNEIHTYWPPYNRAQKNAELNYGIYDYVGNDGYIRLAVDRLRKGSKPVARFDSFNEAFEELRKLMLNHKLCQNKCTVQTIGNKVECDAECLCKTGVNNYNLCVTRAIEGLTADKINMVVVAKGRTQGEKAVILFKQGIFKGYGFVEDSSFNLEQAEEYIKPLKHYGFATAAINSFITRYQTEYTPYYI